MSKTTVLQNKNIQEEVMLIHTESYRQNAKPSKCYNHNQLSSNTLPSIDPLSIITT